MSAPFPLPIEDRLALMDSIARYNLLADQNDIDGYLELFADDGRLMLFVPSQPAPIVDVKGKTTLRAAMHELLSRREKPLKVFQSHPVIEGIAARSVVLPFTSTMGAGCEGTKSISRPSSAKSSR